MRGTPRQVLRRLLGGDPLHLHHMVRSFLDEEFLLLDPEVVHDEVCVAVASSVGLDEYSDSEEFLMQMIDVTCQGLIHGDQPQGGPWNTAWDEIGMRAEVCWQAVAWINRLPHKERQVVHLALLDGLALDEIRRRTSLNAFEVQVILRRTAAALGTLDDPHVSAEEVAE